MPKRPSQASEIVSRDNIVLYTTLCQLSFLTFRYSFPIPKRPAVSSTLFPHFQSRREIFYVARCLGTCRISLSLSLLPLPIFLFIREINYIRDITRFGYARIRRLPSSLHHSWRKSAIAGELSRVKLSRLLERIRQLALPGDKRGPESKIGHSVLRLKFTKRSWEGRLVILIPRVTGKEKEKANLHGLYSDFSEAELFDPTTGYGNILLSGIYGL